MSVSYYRVIRVVWTRNRRLSTAGSPTSNGTITNENLLLRSRKRVLRVLLIVVVCFVICWLPFAVYHGILEQHIKTSPNPMDTVRLITYGLGLANSICNPFIYYFNVGGKSFRSMKRSFLEVMGGKISPPRVVETNTPISRSAHANPVTALQLGFHSTSNAQNYDHHKQTYTAYNNSNGCKFSENALGLQKDTSEDTKLWLVMPRGHRIRLYSPPFRINFRKDFWDCSKVREKIWPIADQRVPSGDTRNNCGTYFGPSS